MLEINFIQTRRKENICFIKVSASAIAQHIPVIPKLTSGVVRLQPEPLTVKLILQETSLRSNNLSKYLQNSIMLGVKIGVH